MTVVTRFAPSPTGHLHIGGARTAIFCWLFARHFGGKFLLRIEDTDLERSKQEYTDSILSSMNWLGLISDEEPIYQTQRFAVYNATIDKLLDSGHAYWCECSAEEVEAMREQARSAGLKPKYDGRCRHKKLGPGAGRVVRLAAPLEGQLSFVDMVKGPIVFDASELDDMVIRRSDGAPTYNLAVVVDDIDMKVSHVIRGDDHVNNTPKQILVYQALGASLPTFAHVPMILGADKQKLSKRHGAKAVIDYEKDGLLAEGLINYLVRLGWSHENQEIFSTEELIRFFDGKNLNTSPAAFDADKLLWVNAQHLRSLSSDELYEKVFPFLQAGSITEKKTNELKQILPLFQPRSSSLVELAEQVSPLLVENEKLHYVESARAKCATPEACSHIKGFASQLAALEEFTATTIHDLLQSYVASENIKFKDIGPALRVALLGYAGGPDIGVMVEFLGKTDTLIRLSRFCE